MAKVELENAKANWTKRLPTQSVGITGGRNLVTGPDQNKDKLVEVGENTYENPGYTLTCVFDPEINNNFTYSDLLDIHTAVDNELYLIVTYGDGDVRPETKLQSAQDGYPDKIPVELEEWDKEMAVADTKLANKPTVTLTFRETKRE